MRDVVVLTIVLLGALIALRRPWIGVILWTWISIMNPHRFAYGVAYGAPVAAIAAGATFIGLLLTTDRRQSPFKSSAVAVFVGFMIWMTLSLLNGLDMEDDYQQWVKVMKIDMMVIVGMMLLHTKRHLFALVWVSVGSLLLLGVKAGIFTLRTGGNVRVGGPPNTFIEDNNEFGLALIMAIPLIRFLQMQVQSRAGKVWLAAAMLLCAAAVLGTQSRGAFLAIAAMALVLWWRGRNRFFSGLVIAAVAVSLLSFMPDGWVDRMNTIETYETDGSAQGRLAAWSAAWNMSFSYPTGVGFNQVRQDLFDRFSHNPAAGARAAHSIYFQVLGNHGFIGLFLFLTIWFLTWRHADWLRRQGATNPEARWCADLGAMVQVSLIGYAVGGAFLSLSYFDLPYNVMMMVAIARRWVQEEGWKSEPAVGARWYVIPGLGTASKAGVR